MESSFRLGFVHFDRSDQDRYLAVLKQLKDSGAVDELGVGQIRDYYSGLLFPGFSVLQQHAKYFVVLPLLFKDAVRRRHDGVSQVKQTIRKLEIELTRSLVAACPADSGITGCDSQAVRSGNGRGDYEREDSDLVPYWSLPPDFPDRTRLVERIVLPYPFSRDDDRYARWEQILSLYRLTMGQPRQEELLNMLKDSGLGEEDMRRLTMNLSPFYRR